MTVRCGIGFWALGPAHAPIHRCFASLTVSGSEGHPAHTLLQDSTKFESIESGLTFLGLVGIKDPARPEVNSAIEDCVQAGIRVIVITGDNKLTAESICRNIGIFDDDENLEGKSFTGRDFLALPEAEQLKLLFSDNRGRVFSRCVCVCVWAVGWLRVLQFRALTDRVVPFVSVRSPPTSSV